MCVCVCVCVRACVLHSYLYETFHPSSLPASLLFPPSNSSTMAYLTVLSLHPRRVWVAMGSASDGFEQSRVQFPPIQSSSIRVLQHLMGCGVTPIQKAQNGHHIAQIIFKYEWGLVSPRGPSVAQKLPSSLCKWPLTGTTSFWRVGEGGADAPGTGAPPPPLPPPPPPTHSLLAQSLLGQGPL